MLEGYENTKWFEITDEAKNQMEKLLSKNPEKYAVSLMVEGGGCAGFKYKWGFIDNKEDVGKDDHTEDWHTGKFVVGCVNLDDFKYDNLFLSTLSITVLFFDMSIIL